MKTKNKKLNQCYQELEVTHSKIKEAYMEMLLRLAVAAEYKVSDIGSHVIRVSDYSTVIAKSLGLPDDEVEIIRYASMMHDIGKIGIPENILGKKAVLSPKEYKKIKDHTIIGNKIFSGSKSPLVNAAGEIALMHHEKYDGTGYPEALKGEEISLYSRIVSLADSFDAIVSKRSYKPSHTLNYAIGEIKKMSGTFFDPMIVEAFLKKKKTIKKILSANITISKFLKKHRP
ncbi:MAG: hypothetical protein COS99_03155 [Candidatus Omnitrophica bacterium CG07_land_8_20_14_0_80_42_15]|uniref:Uncharacterized protein n=1 Tax=Candidatus Aquitaenariimonas noxiae TaxID=1974741 RepID=A0A2J0KVQ3_9BACT|nr:MAG: hypothetical protein COS99_03155 [Candidatus Omnitrophica bacterium CG07_land_8_20_14_0_80_42_15]